MLKHDIRSKYLPTWEEYKEMHPEIDNNNLAAMQDIYEHYRAKLFLEIMSLVS